MSRASEARPGTRGDTTARFNCPSILPLGPGSRIFALAPRSLVRDTRRWRALFAQAAHDLPCPSSRLTMSNSAVLAVPAVRCYARVGRSSFAPDPKRGGRSADRRTYSVVAFARRDGSARVRRGASHDAGRSPLGAPPWRFSAGGRVSISGIASGSVQRLLAARSSCLAGGVPDLPSPRLRAAAAGRHSPLRLRDRLRRRPSMSEDGRRYYIFVT